MNKQNGLASIWIHRYFTWHFTNVSWSHVDPNDGSGLRFNYCPLFEHKRLVAHKQSPYVNVDKFVKEECWWMKVIQSGPISIIPPSLIKYWPSNECRLVQQIRSLSCCILRSKTWTHDYRYKFCYWLGTCLDAFTAKDLLSWNSQNLGMGMAAWDQFYLSVWPFLRHVKGFSMHQKVGLLKAWLLRGHIRPKKL